jgi:hypothetical protein
LFGSEVPLNVIVELTKLRHMEIADAQIEQCLGGIAMRAYISSGRMEDGPRRQAA